MTRPRPPKPLAKRTLVRVAVGATLLVAVLPGAAAWGQPPAPRTVTTLATLTILGGSVRHVAAGGEAKTATDGLDLAIGDHVITGRNASALVTFRDGSTLTVQPGSDITIRRADLERDRSNIAVRINVGTVWARVTRLAHPGSRLSLESNTATATIHDGLLGGRHAKDGTFACWTQAGELVMTDAQGDPLMTLKPGQMATMRPGQPAAFATFFVAFSTLRVTASPNVLPLVQVPEFGQVAGFVAPDIEVNQVYGSVTAATDAGRMVRVPAGHPGLFHVFLEGRQDGPFTVVVEGLYGPSETIYRFTFSGTIARGERLSTSVRQEMHSDGWKTDMEHMRGINYATARVESAQSSPLRREREPFPGKVLLSTAELQALGAR